MTSLAKFFAGDGEITEWKTAFKTIVNTVDNEMINLIKLQPSLSIVLVTFHATEIQCLKQGLRSYASLRSAKC